MSENITQDFGNAKAEYPSIDVKTAVADLWSLVRQTVDKIDKLQSENISLAIECRKLEDTIAGSQDVSSQVSAETMHLKNELDEIERKNAENLRLIESLENELSDYKEKYEAILQEKEIIDAAGDELVELRINREFAQKEIARKNHELHSKDDEIDNLKEKIASLESQLLNVHKTELKEAETKLLEEQYRKEIENLIIENTDLEKRYQADVSGYKKKIDSMQLELNHKDELVANLESEIKDIQSEASANKENNISELTQQIQRLNALKAVNETTIKQLSSKAVEFEKQNNIIGQENRIYQNKINELEHSSEKLREKLASIEAEILSVRNQALLNKQLAGEKAHQAEKVLNEIKSKDEEILLLKEKLNDKSEIILQNESLYGKIEKLESELIKSKNEILLKENLAKELKMRLVEKSRLIALQSEAIIQKDDNLKRLRHEADSASPESKSSAELSERLHQLSKSKAEIETELNELKVMKDELESLVKKRYRQINILEEQLNKIVENNKNDKLKRLELAGFIDDLVVNLERKIAESN